MQSSNMRLRGNQKFLGTQILKRHAGEPYHYTLALMVGG